MYEIFNKLCEENNVTAYRVSKETGIATITFTDWKKGKSTPKQDKMIKIASYFGVTLEYLMTGMEVQEVNLTTLKAQQVARLTRYNELMLKTVEKYGKLSDKDRKTIDDMVDFLSNKEK